MITLKFKGWFQCRLATDPDPSDEPRGISGYMRALPGEPDFDRIIRFHNPLVKRSHTPEVGVYVTHLYNNNLNIENHPLIGAKVDLENDPIFHGWNSIIADDGEEPIVPLDLSISTDDFKIQKKYQGLKYKHPFQETRAAQLIFGANDLLEQTNIYNEFEYISERIAKLQKDLLNSNSEVEKYKIRTRLDWLIKDGISFSFFRFRMNYVLNDMKGPYESNNTDEIIKLTVDTEWNLNFWMGAWDADAQCGFVSGILQLRKAQLVL